MKTKFLITGILVFVAMNSFAQESALKNAEESYNEYLAVFPQRLLAAKAKASIETAKKAIDKASVNETTTTLPRTYALTGAIYSLMALDDTSSTTGPTLATSAIEAVKKAKDADKNEAFKKLIADAKNNLAIYFERQGAKQYAAGKYELAYRSFDNWNRAAGDTSTLYYSALAASNAGPGNPRFYNDAITSYSKLLATDFSQNIKVYNYLSTIYLANRDTANALKTLNAGIAKYPSNTILRTMEIRLYLLTGKDNELLTKLESALAADPNDKLLYFYAGLSYTRVGELASDKAKKAKDDASETASYSSATEYYSKAADYYKKAILIDPNYQDAYLNLGVVMLKPAVDTYHQAYNLPANATQKQYDDVRAKADVQFDLSKPYLLKAIELYPQSNTALTNLWNYYRWKYDKANADENKENAARLKQQIDANSSKN